MGLRVLPRINRIEDELQTNIDQVQTNLDNTPKQFGTPVLVDTQSNTGANFTMSGTESEDGWLSAYFVSQSSESAVSRMTGSVGGTVIVGAFSTGHSAAQFWNGGRAGFTFPVKAGQPWAVVRTNNSGSQNMSAEAFFTPLIP